MSNLPNDFDMDKFQREVRGSLDDINSDSGSGEEADDQAPPSSQASDYLGLALVVASLALEKYARWRLARNSSTKRNTPEKSANPFQASQFQEYVEDAREIICPHLKGTVNDAYEIAKAITPALVAAIAAGTLKMPVDHYVFAGIAIFISRRGIDVLCPEKQNITINLDVDGTYTQQQDGAD